MNADRWQKLKLILAEVLEHESASTRSAVIGRSCANDVDLLREIESLLAEVEGDTTDSLEECANNLAVAVPSQDLSEIGRRVGAYVIIREIGHGGMGTVYLAARRWVFRKRSSDQSVEPRRRQRRSASSLRRGTRSPGASRPSKYCQTYRCRHAG